MRYLNGDVYGNIFSLDKLTVKVGEWNVDFYHGFGSFKKENGGIPTCLTSLIV